MLFYMQTSLDILHANIVHIEIIARRDRAYAVEQTLLAAGHSHARSRRRLRREARRECAPPPRSQLAPTSERSRCATSPLKHLQNSCCLAANSHAIDFEHAIDAIDLFDDAVANAGRRGVQ